MTRVTNFGRKRTYVEAGFDHGAQRDVGDDVQPVSGEKEPSNGASASPGPPPKKKRKRTKKSKRDGEAMQEVGQAGLKETQEEQKSGDHEGTVDAATPATANPGGSTSPKADEKKKKKLKRKELDKNRKSLVSSEHRRLKRREDKLAETVCFACREKGHAAKDCPTTKNAAGKDGNGDGQSTLSRAVVGICYRCGSRRHTLSKCKKPVDNDNPLPFASCFVCNGKGHLASSCPENKAKGIYPNGGCCKLCGETSHLAKDCTLRQKQEGGSLAIFGTGQEAGADEDDFHVLRRKNNHLDKDDKTREKKKKTLQVKAGSHTGVVKSFGAAPKKPKKVVHF